MFTNNTLIEDPMLANFYPFNNTFRSLNITDLEEENPFLVCPGVSVNTTFWLLFLKPNQSNAEIYFVLSI